MKIKIESDIFDIVDRIKDIDEGYIIVYDDIKNKFEIHNMNQINTYCFTSKYDTIDSRIIKEILELNISNIDTIIDDIDRNNTLIEQNMYNKMKDDSNYIIREIYKYSANSSKEYNEGIAFSTIWR